MNIYDKYYAYILGEKEVAIEEKIAFELFRDVDDRSGMLDSIGRDIKEEILTEWVNLVRVNLNGWLMDMGKKHLNSD